MLPIHILIQNLLNDFAQIGMPFDNVDKEYIEKPKKWNTEEIKSYMFAFGIISTILDIICFIVLWYIMRFNTIEKAVLFQTGWFAFIIHMIRTSKIPFVKSKSSKQLLISTLIVTIITLIISFTDIATIFDLKKLPLQFGFLIIALVAIYAIIIQVYKKVYLKINKEWL